ncbi:MAG: hypothetical protein U0K86_07460 [Agathobacter sp.]|nr:hypothetical protein [Agathobacter sp.]
MNYKKYERILNNIVTMAPLECGIQALVFMLLDEIIYNEHGDAISILVADLRDNNCIFGGTGGVLDLCIVNKDFKFVKEGGENFIAQKQNRCGCVEVKAIGEDLSKHVVQLAGHIVEYGKVIYTDGLIWEYYCASKKQIDEIQSILFSNKERFEKADQKIKECKTQLRAIYGDRLKDKRLTKNYIERIKNEEENETCQEICDKALNAFQEKSDTQIDVDKLKKFLNEIIKNNNSWKVEIKEQSLKESKIIINKKKYNFLQKKISNIEWKINEEHEERC